MQELIVMRHGHAASSAASDSERPLDTLGWREVTSVATRLAEARWIPDVIIASDALRTRESAECARDLWGSDTPEVRLASELYLATQETLLETLLSESWSVGRLMLLGHNPGVQELVSWVSGISVRMGTAFAAVLAIADGQRWRDALRQHGGWELVELVRPRV